jgi:hypothetical protein
MPRTHAVLLTLALATAPAAAQSTARWTFRSSPAADLWYHGVALAGFTGFGAQPLYDPAYPGRVRRAREARGTSPTRLEREAAGFSGAFAADSAFELFHFVPLYFAAAEPEEMLDALDAVARGGQGAVAGLAPRVRFGAATVAAVLATPAERATLGRFTTALRDEWPTLRAERAAGSEARASQLAAASRAWSEAEPALRTALAADRLDGGIALAVPSIAAEGRLFAGRPDDRTDNVVAVGLTPGDGEAAAWLAARELAFPAARGALASAGRLPADRVQAERLAGAAAAHLGALRLERPAPALAARYRSALAGAAGCPAFDACFPLPPEARAALAAGR